MVKQRLFACILLMQCILKVAYGATFNDQITLSQFGTATNNNISLQSSSHYTFDTPGQIIRTNDFQTIQLNFGDYATGRYPCRVGVFNVSQCATAVGSVPFGPQLSVASLTLAGDENANIEPNRNLIQVPDPNFLTLSFVETLSSVVLDLSESETSTVANLTYEHSATEFMQDINFPSNAYHDVRYDGVTPKLVFGDGVLIALSIDGVSIPIPSSGTAATLPAGSKFKFIFSNPASDPAHHQTWLVYAQSEVATTTIKFSMGYTLTKEELPTSITLTSQSGIYDGYLRVAVIQDSTPPSAPNDLRPRTSPTWQLATQIQSIPSTPLSMFMLWPRRWTDLVGEQIAFNQETGVYLSSCTTNSLLIPLLALYRFDIANCWYDQLVDKQLHGQVVFDIGTNSFVTLVHMLIAKYYKDDILRYQRTFARGVSTPHLGIEPSAAAMEAMFDNHRSEIPLSAELEFNNDGSYQFYLSTFDVISTFPQSSASLPLFCFPGFKTVADGFNIISNANNKDPIKGAINYVEGNIADAPGSFLIKFKGQELPIWAGRFLPDDFWLRLRGEDKTSLMCQLNAVLNSTLPDYNSSTYDQGKILFQLAMTAKYATYFLLAQQGQIPPYPANFIPSAAIRSRIQSILDTIENLLDGWLISRSFNGQSVSNYFVGDTLGQGIVAVKGTVSSISGVEDSGNAVYTGHNRQYGYFLGAAALTIELDKLFGHSSWIGTTQTNVSSFSGTTKQFLDMLWRDYANPVVDDADEMPFYRYGNSWEGLSSSKGLPPVGAFPSRNNESISEDFNGYYGSYLYARAIQNTATSVISSANQEGFNILETFSKSNLAMIMRAARALFYNNGDWVYTNGPFDFNRTTGIEWDNMVNTGVTFSLGTPPCFFSREGCIYSQYKFDVFCTDLVNQLNSYTQCRDQQCGCQN